MRFIIKEKDELLKGLRTRHAQTTWVRTVFEHQLQCQFLHLQDMPSCLFWPSSKLQKKQRFCSCQARSQRNLNRHEFDLSKEKHIVNKSAVQVLRKDLKIDCTRGNFSQLTQRKLDQEKVTRVFKNSDLDMNRTMYSPTKLKQKYRSMANVQDQGRENSDARCTSVPKLRTAKLGDEEITNVSKKANRTKDSAARLKRKYMAKVNAHNQDKKDIDEDFISLTKKARLQLLVKCCSEGRHGQQDCWS